MDFSNTPSRMGDCDDCHEHLRLYRYGTNWLCKQDIYVMFEYESESDKQLERQQQGEFYYG